MKSKLAPFFLDGGDDAIDGGDVFDVAGNDQIGVHLGRQRLDTLAERFTLIGEGEFSAFSRNRLRDAPGDGVAVGDPHDEAALSVS